METGSIQISLFPIKRCDFETLEIGNWPDTFRNYYSKKKKCHNQKNCNNQKNCRTKKLHQIFLRTSSSEGSFDIKFDKIFKKNFLFGGVTQVLKVLLTQGIQFRLVTKDFSYL